MALCCDYRVQSDTGTFGLNEVALGIPVPKFWARRFVACANDPARADLTLQLGKLLAPREAHALGLLDEVVPAAALIRLRRGRLRVSSRLQTGLGTPPR